MKQSDALAAFKRFSARAMRWPDGCLILFGSSGNSAGHRKVRVGKKVLWAHRVAFEAFNEPLEEGEVARHKCDYPPCIEPGHLEKGSSGENNGDTHRRGRMPSHVLKNLKQNRLQRGTA